MKKQEDKKERVNLTSGRITSFNCPAGKAQAFLWDAEVPGLAVRATPPGKRTPKGGRAFIFQGYLGGSTPRITIGDTKIWSIEKARVEARRLQALLDQGIDPREQKRDLAAAKAAALAAQEAAIQEAENRKKFTLKALCEAYSNLLEAKGKAQSAMQTRSIFKCHVFEAQADLAALPARDITAHQIAAMIRQVSEQGKDRTAGILRSYLSAAFNAARKAPFDAKLPSTLIAYGIESNPVEPVSTIAIKRGNRTLSPDELKPYLAALGDNLADQALKLALYAGGQRMAQLLRAKVSSYDESSQTIRLWDSKGRRSSAREHLLPLAPKGAEIVQALIIRAKEIEYEQAQKEGREPSYGDLWLFLSAGKSRLVETTPGKRVTAISKAMKGEAFDLRDIRRTCETMLAGIGVSRDTRAQLLSHGLSGVQAAHYDRHSYATEKRAALIAWEKRLTEIASGKKAIKPSRRKLD